MEQFSNSTKRYTIPIKAMAANVLREDRDKCFAAGMNRHVGRLLNSEDVLQQLKKPAYL